MLNHGQSLFLRPNHDTAVILNRTAQASLLNQCHGLAHYDS